MNKTNNTTILRIINELTARFETAAKDGSNTIILNMKHDNNDIHIRRAGTNTPNDYEIMQNPLTNQTPVYMTIEELAAWLLNYPNQTQMSEDDYYAKMAEDFIAEQHMYDYCQPSTEELMLMHG